MKRLRRWWWVPLLALSLATAGFLIWAYTPLGPMAEAVRALQSDSKVSVETRPWLIFRPSGGTQEVGLIFYPGGRIDPRSYAPAARSISEQGYLVVIVPMPLNLAVFGANRAADVMSAFRQVDRWAVGGHSLGGAMAARFAHGHPGSVQGLVLWAAYPAASDDLSAQDLAVASVYGTADGVSTGGKIDASRKLLPATTEWVAIEGGNHAQFGWYGSQPGDKAATVSRQAQQEQAVRATVRVLSSLAQK